jgi:hypothetical protein
MPSPAIAIVTAIQMKVSPGSRRMLMPEASTRPAKVNA